MDELVSSTLTKMSIIFFFISYVRVVYICPGVVTPAGQGFLPPFFLGLAIGLELRIRL